MLFDEARWFGQRIAEMEPGDIFPMLNVGSSTEEFRTKKQPWIDQFIFKPIREKGYKVVHTDIKKDVGVDLVGDLTDPHFLGDLSQARFKSVFCSNLLEHVLNREEICQTLLSIIPEGGYIFVSCPYRYPYHEDPIDTMFRPGIEELAALFPGAHLVYGEIVTGDSEWSSLMRNPMKLVKTFVRLLMPFYKPKRWLEVASRVPWFFKRFQVTCLVLRK